MSTRSQTWTVRSRWAAVAAVAVGLLGILTAVAGFLFGNLLAANVGAALAILGFTVGGVLVLASGITMTLALLHGHRGTRA